MRNAEIGTMRTVRIVHSETETEKGNRCDKRVSPGDVGVGATPR